MQSVVKTAPVGNQLPWRDAVRIGPTAGTTWGTRPIRLLGRAIALFVPISAVLAMSGSLPGSLIAATLVTATWFFAFRSACDGAWLAPLALSLPMASALATVTGLAAVTLMNFWVPGMSLSQLELGLMAVGVFITAVVFEGCTNGFVAPKRFVLAGGASAGRALLTELAEHPRLPFECVGFVDDEDEHELRETLRRECPDLVVLGDDCAQDKLLHGLLDTASVGFRVVGMRGFYEHAFGRVQTRDLPLSWFMSVLHLDQRPYSRFTKRVFDIGVAGFGLVISAPLILPMALLVRFSSPGPILFRQTRLGEGGRPFEMLKFRTMIEGAESSGEAIWAQEDDLRTTRIGRLLRSARLDELPQLWSVLRGDMSMVGPRPERPEFLQLIQEEVPFWTRRHLVKPGITGWAQVRQGYTSDLAGSAEKLSYDLYYLKHRSLVLDLAVMAKTASVVLSRSGAH